MVGRDAPAEGTGTGGPPARALDAYVDGRFQSADEHAELSVERAREIGHEFMLAGAIGTRLLSRSARDGAIDQPQLAEALELMRRPSVQPLAAFALWLVARYAAGVAPDTAGRWLAHAERIIATIDSRALARVRAARRGGRRVGDR